MTIPFLDLRASYLELKSEIDSAVEHVLDSGQYILGPEVDGFEHEFATYCGAAHCVGVANGFDALTLGLRGLEIGHGDEVIVPANTFIATWLAISLTGATPVPVEPDPRTHNIDVSRIAEAITSRTRALMPVHLYGRPADMDAILGLSRTHDLAVIEDAAQAHGAQYKGRRIGGHGDIICWSFYPGKNLGALGDGGAITTNRADLADRVRLLRNYGSRTKYLSEVEGVNSRLDPVQAAILRVKLKHLDDWNGRRAAIARRYAEGLAGSGLILPEVAAGFESAWHLYVVRTAMRDALQERLTAAGIGTLIHYPIPPHRQAAYARLRFAPDAFPIASKLADTVISLPIGPQLGMAEVDRIVAEVLAATS